MTVAELLDSVQFVVDNTGERKAVVLDLTTWEALLEVLADRKDTIVAQLDIEKNAISWESTAPTQNTFDTFTDDELMALYGEAAQENSDLAEAGLVEYANGLNQEDVAK